MPREAFEGTGGYKIYPYDYCFNKNKRLQRRIKNYPPDISAGFHAELPHPVGSIMFIQF